MTDSLKKPDTSDPKALRELLKGYLDAGDAPAVGAHLGYLGQALSDSDRKARAILCFESALALHRMLRDSWGVFLDLQTQGETLLRLERGQTLAGALACLSMAAQTAKDINAPDAESAEARIEVILRQLDDRFPDNADQLRKALAEDPESLRIEAIHVLLEDVANALGFFEDNLAVARMLKHPAGEVACLGSVAQVLADAHELRGAAASLVLAEGIAEQIPEENRGPVEAMLAEWRFALQSTCPAECSLENLRAEVSENTESIRLQAVNSLTF